MSTASLSQKAYDHICEQILAGQIPAGAVISEATLARELGVSRTPVGEAIRQLASEGLVEQVPRYGTVVRHVQRDELIELYELREALETFAVAKAAGAIGDAELAHLEKFCAAMYDVGCLAATEKVDALEGTLLKQFLAADMAFHMLIVQSARNLRIQKLVKNTRAISRIFTMQRAPHNARIVFGAHAQHLQILKALRERDSEAARHCMTEHLQTGLQETLRAFDAAAFVATNDTVEQLDLPQDLLEELRELE